MIIPKIDGGKPTIVYNNEYEPVSIYVDGELQTPISAIPHTSEANSTIENIQTEYNKAIKSLELTGTTYQATDVSPIFPQPIENANDNGMSVVLHGYNLLNKEDFTKEALRNETVLNIYGGKCISDEDLHKILKPNTTYRLSFEAEGAEEIPEGATLFGGNGAGFITYNASTGGQAWCRLNTLLNKGEVAQKSSTLTTGDDVTVYSLQSFNFMLKLPDGTQPKLNCIIRNVQITEGAQEKPFQPYFREEIAIPTSVEVEGATVDLRLAHIPKILNDYRATTATDYLRVDRVANKVEYIQGIGKIVFDGTSNFAYRSPNIFKSNLVLNAIRLGNSAYCNKYKLYLGVGSMANQDYGFTTDGQFYGTKSVISIKDIRFDNVADFKADLEQNPVEVLYCLETPITHDITNTDLGQSLLALNLKRKDINVLEVDSNPNAPQVPTKLIYNIWGGRNENNNNT